MKIQEARKFVRAFRGGLVKRYFDTYHDDLDIHRKVFHMFYGATFGLLDSEEEKIGHVAYRSEEEALRIIRGMDNSRSEEEAKGILESLLKASESVIYRKHDLSDDEFRLSKKEDENGKPILVMDLHNKPYGTESCN
jgi:hypothetical protein